MDRIRQIESTHVELVEDSNGEVTLYINGGQAMQGWERDLMIASADLMCRYGSEFLEVGLGLGISALHIANHPHTRRHTVVELNQMVIDIFHARHPRLPPTLSIVKADFFDYVYTLAPASLDGIFFDPFIPPDISNEPRVWDEVVPLMVRALRRGGALVPFFSLKPVLRWPFIDYFDAVFVEKHPFTAYATTEYTASVSGEAFVQCFIKTTT